MGGLGWKSRWWKTRAESPTPSTCTARDWRPSMAGYFAHVSNNKSQYPERSEVRAPGGAAGAGGARGPGGVDEPGTDRPRPTRGLRRSAARSQASLPETLPCIFALTHTSAQISQTSQRPFPPSQRCFGGVRRRRTMATAPSVPCRLSLTLHHRPTKVKGDPRRGQSEGWSGCIVVFCGHAKKNRVVSF